MKSGLSRRDFLRLGGFGAAYGLAAPGWLIRAMANEPEKEAAGRVLVLVTLSGGNDGLNTVIPLSDPLYAKARPTLAIPKDQILRINDEVGFHPSMKRLRELFDDGRVAVVQNVGYAGQDRSHFRSMEIWQTAQTDGPVRDGWLGRCMCDPGGGPHSVALGSEAPLALWAESGGVLAMENPAAFDVGTDTRHFGDRGHVLKAFREIYAVPRSGPAEFVRRRGLEVFAQAERVKALVQKPAAQGAQYPNSGLAGGLKFVASAVEDRLGPRVYMLTIGGFDTHANQRQAHAGLLQTVSEAVVAFQKDLEARGVADHVLTMTFSEFGRRVAENVSQGTDHGAAAPLFMIGKGVKGGLRGGAPNLETLDQGDLAWTVDFRSVYATVLERWMGVEAKGVVGEHELLDVI